MNNIGTIDYPAPKQEYKVLVRCYTYNHSKYIEDALNGFAMQQTNFPFVCLVVDDASMDGEQEVIKAWMESECAMSRAETIDIPTSVVIIVPHKSNSSCTFAFYLLKQNLYRVKGEKKKHIDPWREKCVYEAMCEGDDYWISANKLSLQVEYMDANSECGLCYTDFHRRYECSNRFDFNVFHSSHNGISPYAGNPESVILKGGFFCPPSWLYRISLFNSKPIIKTLDGSFVLFVHAISMSEVYFLDEVTTVYRVSNESATHSKDPKKIYEREISLLGTKLELIRHYNYDSQYNEKVIINFFNKNVFFLISVEKTKDILEHRLYPCFSGRTRFFSKIATINILQQILKFVYNKIKY